MNVVSVNSGHPLRYHGDQAAAGARLDFAVNVVSPSPPEWLQRVLIDEIPRLGSYPPAELQRRAVAAVAAGVGVDKHDVLLLNGAAEGFSLLSRLQPRSAVVLHPGFTEPQACLEDAGVTVGEVIMSAPYTLDTVAVDEAADMVVIGNPTNPTGVLHPVDQLSALARPGRFLVVDEAFLDVTGGESMASLVGRLPGLIVLRSLTKTWSIAGLRCGFLIADPQTVDRLAAFRPHWPLGTLQLAAMIAVMDRGGEFLPGISADIAAQRADMVASLGAAGFHVHPSRAPYLLVNPPGDAEGLRLGLAARGIAVRRCDTFPGLDSRFWRLAVRPPEQVDALLEAVEELTRVKDVRRE
ncbi:Rv2231c family pyridoxal phosphate-dependent protein CobC [Corynebacterium pacaense]|uniref:Rv2231c family pyridoxal phosphate-dependent protein CobC n=1 Tax=Corynebacterium pacaense TaxID=1816684 RepID=UPI0009BAC615|nr:Rv2231c family pyridoxal phosphate-dependent protein CobC [Corynebacterium pacaense]